MNTLYNITDFLNPLNLHELSHDAGYREGQIGKFVLAYETEFPSLEEADLVLVGCGEVRGNMSGQYDCAGPDAIRHQFYSL
jgi:hypothetical protein